MGLGFTNIFPQQDKKSTAAEWAAVNSTRITDWDVAENSTTIMYTVPANTTAYITNVWLSVNPHTSTTQLTGWMKLHTFEILYLETFYSGSGQSLALSFTMPFKLTAGQTISIFSSTSQIRTSGGFVGWIEEGD